MANSHGSREGKYGRRNVSEIKGKIYAARAVCNQDTQRAVLFQSAASICRAIPKSYPTNRKKKGNGMERAKTGMGMSLKGPSYRATPASAL